MSSDWMKALEAQGLEVTSARDGMTVTGYLDSGNYALNWAISGKLQGGYPLGHSVEIFGDPSTGKSFLCTRAMSMVQAAGGNVLLDDTEGAYNLDWIHILGVDSQQLAMPAQRSHTVNEHLGVARAFIAAYAEGSPPAPGLLVCDSQSQLSTEHELEKGLDKRDLRKAAELKAFYRIIGADLNDLPVSYIVTSHTIAEIGGFGNSRTTSGGGGPKFHASVRVDLRMTSKMKRDNEYTGVIVRAVIAKNRFTAPFKEVRLAVPWYQAISRASGLVDLLIRKGIIATSGKKLVYHGTALNIPFHKSKDAFLKQDDAGEELLDQVPEILEEADEVFAQQTVPAGMIDYNDEEEDPEEVEE